MSKFVNVMTETSMISGLSVIEHEGALWIVTGWLGHKTRPVKRPVRLIRMTGLQYEELDPEQHGSDYLVNQPIPRGVLDGTIASEEATGFVVLDTPKIEIPVSKPH
ncbi:hypothetical protein [Parasphingopyxis sp.]|uniref:hypothetical protein n=1 Tax=Parasphingopyxis sp. TaxID=1920299 RepID=UPI0026123174|nr:hypothetical protein [Parasphingopyxis sp.]